MLHAPQPFSFLLFGASGHLAKVKIYPALYVLALKERLPQHYNIVGYARSEFSDDSFRSLIEESIREHVPAVNEDVLSGFLSHCFYQQGQYDSSDDFAALATRLEKLEEGWGERVRLAYFSIPPSTFSAVAHNLCDGGVKNDSVPLRCIVEKPVGHDLASFEVLKNDLLGCFNEESLYLLDHYLGKDAVRNVYYLRRANPILERIFKNTLIDHVQIHATESTGIHKRAGYFESAGTFRDMFQSHLLMMSALLTMRLGTQETIDGHRSDAVKQFYLPPVADTSDLIVQGQYEGYLDEDGVDPNSKTNTFACMKLQSRMSKWEGVPFYLLSGKRLAKKETRISMQFQEPHPVGEGASPNRLDVILQGEAGMKMYLQTRISGQEPTFRPLIMEDPLVCTGDCLPEHSLLLLEAIHGIREWFLRFDDIQTAWRLIDPLQTYLDSSAELEAYEQGANGPDAMNQWIQRDGREWFV